MSLNECVTVLGRILLVAGKLCTFSLFYISLNLCACQGKTRAFLLLFDNWVMDLRKFVDLLIWCPYSSFRDFHHLLWKSAVDLRYESQSSELSMQVRVTCNSGWSAWCWLLDLFLSSFSSSLLSSVPFGIQFSVCLRIYMFLFPPEWRHDHSF